MNRYYRRGFTLIEATMAMVMLSIVAAGILLPFSAAAASQTHAQRAAAAARMAADAIDTLADEGVLDLAVFHSQYAASPAYAGLTCQIQTQPNAFLDGLTLVEATVRDGEKPLATLRTLMITP